MKKENPLAEKFETVPWECIKNHLPTWTDDLKIDALMRACGEKRMTGLIDRYCDIQMEEEAAGTDAHLLYGKEDEKAELIDDMVKIFEYYLALVKSGPNNIAKVLFPASEVHQQLWLDGYNFATYIFAPYDEEELLPEAIALMRKIVTDTNPAEVMETYNKIHEFLNKADVNP